MPPESPSHSSCRAAEPLTSSAPLAGSQCAAAESPWPASCCFRGRQAQQQQQLQPEADGSCAASSCKCAASPAGKENHAACDQAPGGPFCKQGPAGEARSGDAAEPQAQSSMHHLPSGCSGAAVASGHRQRRDMRAGGTGQLGRGRRGQGAVAGWEVPALVRVDESAPLRALCGVRVVWTSMEARRQGVASKLLDLARWDTALTPLFMPSPHAFSLTAELGNAGLSVQLVKTGLLLLHAEI